MGKHTVSTVENGETQKNNTARKRWQDTESLVKNKINDKCSWSELAQKILS